MKCLVVSFTAIVIGVGSAVADNSSARTRVIVDPISIVNKTTKPIYATASGDETHLFFNEIIGPSRERKFSFGGARDHLRPANVMLYIGHSTNASDRRSASVSIAYHNQMSAVSKICVTEANKSLVIQDLASGTCSNPGTVLPGAHIYN
jgi:hypothetical protein